MIQKEMIQIRNALHRMEAADRAQKEPGIPSLDEKALTFHLRQIPRNLLGKATLVALGE